jgi:hypothetical protein
MTPTSNFNFEQAKEIADLAVFEHSGRHLNDTEMLVLKGSWEGLTYEQMSQTFFRSVSYLQTDVGHHLWKKLSSALGEPVRKPNFKEALGRRASQAERFPPKIRPFPFVDLPFPEGAVPLDSLCYLERQGVESSCYSAISKPGSLIRIKASRFMGKTSLMTRIIAQAQAQNYRTAYLDLSTVERGIVTHLEKFLRWFCAMVGRELHIEDQVEKYWDSKILGSNDNCTVYFEEYLLPTIDSPLVLGLDNVDRIFAHPEVVEDFLGMLRSWHEKAKISPHWKQLRLVMAHSTECYVPLDMNQSPFNAGVPIELQEFDQGQVDDLACHYDLNWSNEQSQSLMRMVGGHPYLIGLALYEVGTQKISLDQLLDQASTEVGIYRNHLRRLLATLQKSPDLIQAFKKVVTSSVPAELDSIQIYKLHSMGLIQQKNNYVLPRCDMYRQYFCRVLST